METNTDDLNMGGPSPKEVYERLKRYLEEIDNLLAGLREGLSKGEEQIAALKEFVREALMKYNIALSP